MLLSALYVRYRDVQPIWEVALQMLFYASPVIYVTATIPEQRPAGEAMANPIAAILTQMRHARRSTPRPRRAADVAGRLAVAAVPLAIVRRRRSPSGSWVFMREAPRIAENL